MSRSEPEAARGVLELPARLGARVLKLARARYPDEACGLLIGRRCATRARVELVREARNVAAARARERYELDPVDHLAAEELARSLGLEVVGVWHSHPDHPALPSETDRERAWEGVVVPDRRAARRRAALLAARCGPLPRGAAGATRFRPVPGQEQDAPAGGLGTTLVAFPPWTLSSGGWGRMSGQSDIDQLVALALDRFEEGGEAALEAFLAEHPRESERVRRCLETLHDVGLLAGAERDGELPERLGEFRLIESLGAGGMGIVYRAIQEPLGREVALKVIRPEQLFFRGARERFRREVETVARLQHPGIVAVHAVGEQDGVPYFAMELVRGRGLDAILAGLAGRDPRELSGRDLDPSGAGSGYLFEGTWEEACLRAVRQVCEALEFAHQNGVLHRDIKPSNVMITSEGAPRVLLLDFGLATGGGDGARLTRSGSQVGSLRYMSSEQVRGESERIGPRTDVYGLGVTLYELLCNAPAYSGRSDAELILAIERGDLPRLRSRNPHASWEAETICATATDRDPARRYASASDLARDLWNALERRPIEARRAGALLRARRWIQRRPATATATLLGGLVVVGGPSIYAWREVEASRQVQAQLERTERVTDLALESMDRMLMRLGAEDLRLVPQVEPVRRAALEDAVELAERLAREREDDPRVRSSAADAHARLGRLLSELGRQAPAAEALGRAVERLTDDARRDPPDRDASARLLGLRIDHAQALSASGRPLEARPLLEGLREELGPRRGDPRFDVLYAGASTVLGEVLTEVDRIDEARAVLAENARSLDRQLEERPDDDALLQAGQQGWNQLGLLLSTRFTSEEGAVDPETLPAMQRALELAQRLAQRKPDEPQRRMLVASSRGILGGVYRRLGRNEEALACYEEGRRDLEPLVRDFPSTLSYKLELATQRNQLGLVHDTVGWELSRAGEKDAGLSRRIQAEPHYRATVELLEEVAVQAPQEPIYHHRLAIARYNLAAMTSLVDPESSDELALLDGAVAAAKRARDLAPANGEILRTLLASYQARVDVLLRSGDVSAAAAAAEDLPTVQPQGWQGYARASVSMARCVQALRDRMPTEDVGERIEALAERGAAFAREAIARGVPEPEHFGELEDLAALRGTRAFERLIEEVAAGRSEGER